MQRLSIWLTVALTLLRELLRTLAVPFRVVAYLPFRHYCRRFAKEALDDGAQT